ncbi:MAG: Cytochrome-c oxidase [Acidimicrobiaceae bacterium]|nr:Cytochrome-c oxidase [Acidimicrobiaceae bacterium]
MTTTLEHATTMAQPKGGGLARHQNFATAIVAGVVLAWVGWFLGRHLFWNGSDNWSDQVTILTLLGWMLGFWIGIGAFNAPFQWLLGRDNTRADNLYYAGDKQGRMRYWKFTTDHKVVGVQYIIVTMGLLAVGGILAMAIRTELITPGTHFVNQQVYNSFIAIHGMVMILALIVAVAGPWGNFVMPIMIGARDMAFPRLNALSLWTLVSAATVLVGTLAVGGLPVGWVVLGTIANQAGPGMDFFAVAIVIFTVSTTVASVNLITTVITMRTRGMTLDRLPIFVWGTIITAALALYAFPFFFVAEANQIFDRTASTSFYVAAGGGTSWLQANLFWLMGHPEVYVILIPAVAALFEISSTMARKPVFSYRTAVGAMVVLAGLSAVVWAHHMFTAGWAPSLSGPFMVTTELISIPTGIFFLVLVGTLWRGNVWMKLPTVWMFGFIFNFIVGGVTGIYLSDVPLDEQLHGTMFVTAHFHYIFVGSVLFGAIAALAYWFPKVSGRYLNEFLGRLSFWLVFSGVQLTFGAMFLSGLKGMPRRDASYSFAFEHTNFISTIGAYMIMSGMLVLLGAVITSWRSGEPSGPNPWRANTLEWQVPTPPPLENFDVLPVITEDPYHFDETTVNA